VRSSCRFNFPTTIKVTLRRPVHSRREDAVLFFDLASPSKQGGASAQRTAAQNLAIRNPAEKFNTCAVSAG
jgi:hypothetical protein